MLKHTMVAIAAVIAGAGALPAVAAQTGYVCQLPVLQLSEDPADRFAQYTVKCNAKEPNIVAPVLTFSGEIDAQGSSPYFVKASYTVDPRDPNTFSLDATASYGQVATGQFSASAESLAVLPALFADSALWDANNNVLSVKEKPALWHVFTVDHVSAPMHALITDAGYASEPVK